MKKRIFIITEGGKGIGFGHLSRCFSLYHALRQKGEEPVFLVNEDSSALSFLASLGGKEIQTRHRAESLNGVQGLGGELAVVDSYRLPLPAYQEIAGRFDLLVSIDDENRLPYPPGFVVNGALYASELPYPRRPGVNLLLGPDYFLLRPEYMGIPPREVRREIRDILITVGGVDWCHLTQRLIKIAGEMPGVTLHVLTTDGFDDLEGIHRSADEVPAKVLFYHNRRNLVEVMRRCDIALSAGGQTTYELAACGTPTVGVCTVQNQLKNLLAWEKAGFLLFAGWENDSRFGNKMRQCLETITPQETRAQMSREGRKRIDGRGPARVAGAILYPGESATPFEKAGNF